MLETTNQKMIFHENYYDILRNILGVSSAYGDVNELNNLLKNKH